MNKAATLFSISPSFYSIHFFLSFRLINSRVRSKTILYLNFQKSKRRVVDKTRIFHCTEFVKIIERSHPIPSYPHPIQSHPIPSQFPSHPIQSQLILSHPIASHPIPSSSRHNLIDEFGEMKKSEELFYPDD